MTGTALSCTRKSAISTVFYRNAPDLPFHLAFLTGLLCRTPAAAAAYLAAFCGMSKNTIVAPQLLVNRFILRLITPNRFIWGLR